ncbi:MAG: DUF4450 domain-containing protein [Rikenellaceae bacterium]|nr:DUF4450 domain-containing protein [Rikenellaceae bacterium]
MKRLCLGLLFLGWLSPSYTQHYSESQEQLYNKLYAEHKRMVRAEHYHPQEGGVFTINGKARYNRALYGAHTGFRMECSDWPIFGIFLPGMGGNLTLKPSAKICKASYIPGKMCYDVSSVIIEAQVMREGEDVALWRIENASLREQHIEISFGGVSGQKFYRNGDIGVDDPDCFALKDSYCTTNRYRIKDERIVVDYSVKKEEKAITLILPLDDLQISDKPHLTGSLSLRPNEVRYLAYFPSKQPKHSQKKLKELFEQAEQQRAKIANSFSIDTPEEWLNPIAPALAIAADGIWSGRTWLHGAIGWRTEHLGWRGAYVGTSLGWHDRAQTHFRTYADNMVRDVEPVFDHPRQDSTLNLARAEKRWGTPMYSNGYICRRPGKREMSHYDMNLVYIDALLRHIRATGDEAFMREMFPTLKLHLEWEKRNFDPDGDHLYDGYCCIWASDALYYSGGKVTHSSAYNYFANKEVARIAERIGEDPTPYRQEAEAIYEAMHRELWDPIYEHWGEYRETRGHERLHSNAALWTLYHTMDSECNTPIEQIANIAGWDFNYVRVDFPVGTTTGWFYDALPATTNWQPYAWSINNVAIAEVMHTALAAWQAGDKKLGYKLMKNTALDNMYYGTSPLNFGQLSHFDAARGECYRDFADPIGVWSRALTEGLFGIRPDLTGHEQRVTVQPAFPDEWAYGGINLPDISYRMERDSAQTTYTLSHNYPAGTMIELIVEAQRLNSVTLNGESIAYTPIESTYTPKVKIRFTEREAVIRIDNSVAKSEAESLKTHPMRNVVYMEQNGIRYWDEAHIQYFIECALPREYFLNHTYRMVEIDSVMNARVTDIYRNQYLSNRPKNSTTLQIPMHGFSEWCHPTDTVSIDDSGLRNSLLQTAIDDRAGRYIIKTEGVEIPFRLIHTGQNICYTSLWDNYPTSVTIPMEGKGYRLWLAMAGSTNPMQWGVANGVVRIRYRDGEAEEYGLHPSKPKNGIRWTSIEADPYYNYGSFSVPYFEATGNEYQRNHEVPIRILLKTGEAKRLLGDKVGNEGMGSPYVDGGAAILMPFEINPDKELEAVELETLSNDVVIGLMGITVEE